MNIPAKELASARPHGSTTLPLWTLVTLYAAATALPLFPDKVPLTLIVGAPIVLAVLFALVHGAFVYRLRGVLVFAAICLVAGNVIENIGVRTGFPFGHYYFTAGMGPKLFLVPILMGPAYLGMGYVSWTLGRLMVAGPRGPVTGAGPRAVTVPLAASFVMVAWDLTMDPALSTVGHYWIWQQGGAYFGVPVTNFLGWYLTNYIIYQLFALYLRQPALAAHAAAPNSPPAGYWRLAIIFYALMAAGAVLRTVPTSGAAAVADATGALWRVSDINAVCALVSVFIMGAFVLLAAVRLTARD
jgi:uncharacterized membrane protein